MIDPYWFQKKWGFSNIDTPLDSLIKRLEELEARVKVLEEENVETTNELYRLENSIESRIDILIEHLRIDYDV